MVIGLGPAGDSSRFRFPGHHEKLPSSSANTIWAASAEAVTAEPGSARTQVSAHFLHLDKSI